MKTSSIIATVGGSCAAFIYILYYYKVIKKSSKSKDSKMGKSLLSERLGKQNENLNGNNLKTSDEINTALYNTLNLEESNPVSDVNFNSSVEDYRCETENITSSYVVDEYKYEDRSSKTQSKAVNEKLFKVNKNSEENCSAKVTVPESNLQFTPIVHSVEENKSNLSTNCQTSDTNNSSQSIVQDCNSNSNETQNLPIACNESIDLENRIRSCTLEGSLVNTPESPLEKQISSVSSSTIDSSEAINIVEKENTSSSVINSNNKKDKNETLKLNSGDKELNNSSKPSSQEQVVNSVNTSVVTKDKSKSDFKSSSSNMTVTKSEEKVDSTIKSFQKRNRKRRKRRKGVSSNDQKESDNNPVHNSSDPSPKNNPKSSSPNLETSTSKNNSKTPDQAFTSDLEREASNSPEQNLIDSLSLVSHASADSGQGSLEVDQEGLVYVLPENYNDQIIPYQFLIPQYLAGRLIGKKGSFINKLKSSTNTEIVLINHDKDYKICTIEGKRWEVYEVIEMIKAHFPQDSFPEFNLAPLNEITPQNSVLLSKGPFIVEIPPGVVLDVQVSTVVSTGEVWVQQPLHPSFQHLQKLLQCMNLNYGNGESSPELPLPIPTSTICACKVKEQWLRGMVVEQVDTYCTLTLLDIGGVVCVPVSELRQIRMDYAGLPFQAAQCYLAGIQPVDGEGWTEEGRQALIDMVQKCLIYVVVAAYSPEGVPIVNLYQRRQNQYKFINKELIDLGHAKAILNQMVVPS